MEKLDTIINLRDGQTVYELVVEFLGRLFKVAQECHPSYVGSLKEDIIELVDNHHCQDKLFELRDHPKKTERIEKDIDGIINGFFQPTDNDTDFAEHERKQIEESKEEEGLDGEYYPDASDFHFID